MDVAPACILDPPRASDGIALSQRLLFMHQPLNLFLIRIGELEAVGAKQLDAVVIIRIVAGGNHHANIGAHFTR